MKLKNKFTTETRYLFFDIQYICIECKRNGQDCGGVELHHILGRVSASPFNACVLCKECHSTIGHNFEEEKKYLQINAKHIFKLITQGLYKLTEEDKLFLKQNEKYY